ncbi:innexin inx1 [Harmonia axyridis]|uniref:innexin inx1 n=1 Tax=Harmonia axyridis TaxID=115357 RepID=UPI001E278C9E|nr:innexin inx1 [Harmonia axyridis]
MFKLLGGLAHYLKQQDIVTDCAIFRLHNLFTTALLMGCSLIITATQYVGRPIQCIVQDRNPHVVNTFCWISSTFTMADAFNRQIGSEVAAPGLSNDFDDVHAHKYYTYYQWVCFALFFQGLACYTPKFIWDKFEGGLMKTLVMGLNIGATPEKVRNARKEIVIEYLLEHLKKHRFYAIRYWCCECLCLVNIIVQLYLMNKFFDGEFLSYGLRVMNYSNEAQEERVDPMVYIFPRLTKCNFYKYGPSGSIQKLDSLCVLPLNIVNEKTYIFLWFWFMILASLLTILVIYRVCMMLFPKFRTRIFHSKNYGSPYEVSQTITRKTDIGDWWVLYMLGTNMDSLIFKEMISELSKRIEVKSSNRR